MKYLVVKCTELNDQYECDADRKPLCVVDNYTEYNKRGYEIYLINNNGSLKQIRTYNEVSETYIAYCEYNNDGDDGAEPTKCMRLKEGDRDNITISDIKKWKTQFNFTETLDEMQQALECCGEYGEPIGDKWHVVGEAFDDIYPRGY